VYAPAFRPKQPVCAGYFIVRRDERRDVADCTTRPRAREKVGYFRPGRRSTAKPSSCALTAPCASMLCSRCRSSKSSSAWTRCRARNYDARFAHGNVVATLRSYNPICGWSVKFPAAKAVVNDIVVRGDKLLKAVFIQTMNGGSWKLRRLGLEAAVRALRTRIRIGHRTSVAAARRHSLECFPR
jgi:hypothetical protein